MARSGTGASGIAVDIAAQLIVVAVLTSLALDVQGAPRILLVLTFTTFVPGWAVVRLIRPAVDLTSVTLAVAASLALCLAGATLMVWSHAWNPMVLFGVLAAQSMLSIQGRLVVHAAAGSVQGLPEGVTPDRQPMPANEPVPPPSPVSPPPRDILRSRRRRLQLRPSDALVPLSVVLWALSVREIRPQAMNDFGLLPALPFDFRAALGMLALAIGLTLGRTRLSAPRLALQLALLVLMLHGTTPMAFPEPDYSWVYKHFGVVQHISLYGTVDERLDIYQNWPGFFALAAWFDAVAGVGSPIQYAAWAQVYFGLLFILAMGFAIQAIAMPARLRWLALFIFVSANWVAQDYFSPQAFSFALSLIVVGALLKWFRSERQARWVVRLVGWTRRRLGGHGPPDPPSDAGRRLRGTRSSDRPASASDLGWWSRIGLLVAIYAIFAAVVVSHQLSPYMVIAGVAVLTVAGAIRPRWIVLGLSAIAIGYLLTHLNPVTRGYVQLVSLNPFHNTVNETVANNAGVPGRLFAADTARALSLAVWALAAVGAVRRFRQGAPVLVPLVLMVSPAAIVFGQDYGGEATYRVFLFSLPWAAVLAASALGVGPYTAAASAWLGRTYWPDRWTSAATLRVTVVLAELLALFLPAYYGLAEVNYIRPTDVAASQYFYAHGTPHSLLILATPYFPVRIAGNYDNFFVTTRPEPTLTDFPPFRHRFLTARDVPEIEALTAPYGGRSTYLVISSQMKVASHVFQLLPDGSLDSLSRALAASPDWRLFYRNRDVVIYELAKPP
jgi:hypothetical protein